MISICRIAGSLCKNWIPYAMAITNAYWPSQFLSSKLSFDERSVMTLVSTTLSIKPENFWCLKFSEGWLVSENILYMKITNTKICWRENFTIYSSIVEGYIVDVLSH